MNENFRIGITRDFLKPDGSIGFGDVGLNLLDETPGITREFLSEDAHELTAQQIADFDALLVLSPRVTEQTLKGAERLKIVARFGVGYDNVDVDACTQNDVLLTITPDGVRRPVAVAVMTLILALGGKLLIKDRLTRAGRWSEKLDHMGMGVTGRTLGVVGLGNIGREVFRLASPFGMRHVGYDPHVNKNGLQNSGIEFLELDELLQVADYVCLCCALVPETRHLINAERLALMKPTSYLINVARGPIVDQRALTQALREQQIQGAGLDVFEEEPIAPDDPLLTLDNVIVTPHALSWTDECFRGIGMSACRSILDVAAGTIPENVVNRHVLSQPGLAKKLRGPR